MASGTVPVPGLVLVSCCLGVWVSKFPLSERRDPWQSLVTAVPRPNSASAPPRLPSPCPALPVHAGHREKASEGEAWQPTLPGSWTSISSHYVESAHCPVGGPPAGPAQCDTENCSCHCWVSVSYQASQPPSREVQLPFYRGGEQGPAEFGHLPKVTANE